MGAQGLLNAQNDDFRPGQNEAQLDAVETQLEQVCDGGRKFACRVGIRAALIYTNVCSCTAGHRVEWVDFTPHEA